MLSVENILDRYVWEKFNTSFSYPAFFQSWDIGEAAKGSGAIVYRLGLFRKDVLMGIAQIFEIKAKRGHFFHIRQGPVMSPYEESEFTFFIKHIFNLAKKKRVSFIRLSPLIEISSTISFATGMRVISSPVHNQDAENCWVLDISNSEKILLGNMRKTTRYLIRRGESEAIEIVCKSDKKYFNEFMMLYKQTLELKNFVGHKNILGEFEAFAKQGKAYLYIAYKEKIPLSSAIIIDYGNQSIYRHGASSIEGRRGSSSYLVQWRAICDAKRRGSKIYNFWGIVPPGADNLHPWQGLTLFKMGFGGKEIDFMHAKDIVVNPSYYFTYAVDRVTTMMKGYG